MIHTWMNVAVLQISFTNKTSSWLDLACDLKIADCDRGALYPSVGGQSPWEQSEDLTYPTWCLSQTNPVTVPSLQVLNQSLLNECRSVTPNFSPATFNPSSAGKNWLIFQLWRENALWSVAGCNYHILVESLKRITDLTSLCGQSYLKILDCKTF